MRLECILVGEKADVEHNTTDKSKDFMVDGRPAGASADGTRVLLRQRRGKQVVGVQLLALVWLYCYFLDDCLQARGGGSDKRLLHYVSKRLFLVPLSYI